MPKSKNHTYAAEYPKTQLLFNIFIFYKKFTEVLKSNCVFGYSAA